MGTRSVTKIHVGDKNSDVLVAIYQQLDGYFEGVGEKLQNFLDGYAIVNGIGINTPKKSANGMGCLAAQLVKYLKDRIGGTYITTKDDVEDYVYDIYLRNGKLCLSGEGGGKTKKFKIKSTVDEYYKI